MSGKRDTCSLIKMSREKKRLLQKLEQIKFPKHMEKRIHE